MGCDIHLHSEIKIQGTWYHYSHVSVTRSYTLFGKMAGVRNKEVTPLSLPKGIPSDCSVVTLMDYEDWNGDAHSASFLSWSEIVELGSWIKNRGEDEFDYFGYFLHNDYSDVSAAPDYIEDVRFVFWFDN